MEQSKIVTRRKNKSAIARIESFSDSVFGFAITLMVIDLLQIPRLELEHNLIDSLEIHWQSLLAFLIGFCTILICWINHHHVFCYVVRYDGRFLWINGILLLIVTFTPLPTSIFAAFLLKENTTGLILFGFTYFLISIVATLIWNYSYTHNLLNKKEDKTYYQSILLLFRACIAYSLVAFFVCFYSSVAAVVMYCLMFSIFAFPHYFSLKVQRYLKK